MMRQGRLLAYQLAVMLIGVAVAVGLRVLRPGISRNEILLFGMPILFVLIVLLPMRFKALRIPRQD